MSHLTSQEIHFRSYNPYESLYPGLRVVSRDTLHLIKALRARGYSVVVEPDDGTKLTYLAEKGLHEVLSDPIWLYVIGIPTSLFLNLIATWVSSTLNRPATTEEVDVVVEFDEGGNRARYSQSGRPISEERFKSILLGLETRKRNFEESRKVASPQAEYFLPIHLEHTGKVVGWAKGFVFDEENMSIAIDTAKILDDETWKRIIFGELIGFSIAGIVSSATCLICNREYVECNHVSGQNYDGQECTVRVTILPAEVSIVRDPVQPAARIKLK